MGRRGVSGARSAIGDVFLCAASAREGMDDGLRDDSLKICSLSGIIFEMLCFSSRCWMQCLK